MMPLLLLHTTSSSSRRQEEEGRNTRIVWRALKPPLSCIGNSCCRVATTKEGTGWEGWEGMVAWRNNHTTLLVHTPKLFVTLSSHKRVCNPV